MKKFSLLIAVVIALSFSGCSKDKSDSSDNSNSSKFDPNNPVAKDHIEYAKEAGKELEKFINENEAKLEQEKADKTKNFENNLTKVSGDSFELGEVAKLDFKAYGIEYSETYDEDIITVKADFTNLSDRDMSFLSFLNHMTVYQDDAVITLAFSDYDYETGTSIKPGKTLEIAFSYILRDTTSDIVFEGMDSERNDCSGVLHLK